MISPAIAPDSFTWSRVTALIRLMLPRLKTLMAVAITMGLLSTLFIWFSSRFIFGIALMSIVVLIPALTFYISPVFIGSAVSAPQFGQLPATPGEKLTALLLILLTFGLIAYYLPQGLTTVLITQKNCPLGMSSVSVSEIYNFFGPVYIVLSYIGSALPALVCLYCITSQPGRRWRAGLMALVVIFVQGLLGGAYGMISAFREGFKAGLAGKVLPPTDEIYENLLSSMEPFLWIYIFLVVICCFLTVWLTYRRMAGKRF